MKIILILTLLLFIQHEETSAKINLKSTSNAPAYWSTQCGDRTYVGTYTLMMDWTECRDYCQYFPHAGELGHSFTFADILDTDTMECLRYNMNQQYTPGNGYAGHYWAGGYRGGDGQYRWDSGEPFDFHDFIGNPGDEPYIHLTPGNNYQWNTKSDQNDRNNGCLCKSEQTTRDVELTQSECPVGWVDLGPYCVYIIPHKMSINDSRSVCQGFGGDLISWFDQSEFMPIHIWIREMCIDPQHEYDCTNEHWTNANDLLITGVYMWGDGPELVATEYWEKGMPRIGESHCARMNMNSELHNVSFKCHNAFYPICQIRK